MAWQAGNVEEEEQGDLEPVQTVRVDPHIMTNPLLSRIPWDRVNWTTSIFLAVINTLALTAVPLYLWH